MTDENLSTGHLIDPTQPQPEPEVENDDEVEIDWDNAVNFGEESRAARRRESELATGLAAPETRGEAELPVETEEEKTVKLAEIRDSIGIPTPESADGLPVSGAAVGASEREYEEQVPNNSEIAMERHIRERLGIKKIGSAAEVEYPQILEWIREGRELIMMNSESKHFYRLELADDERVSLIYDWNGFRSGRRTLDPISEYASREYDSAISKFGWKLKGNRIDRTKWNIYGRTRAEQEKAETATREKDAQDEAQLSTLKREFEANFDTSLEITNATTTFPSDITEWVQDRARRGQKIELCNADKIKILSKRIPNGQSAKIVFVAEVDNSVQDGWERAVRISVTPDSPFPRSDDPVLAEYQRVESQSGTFFRDISVNSDIELGDAVDSGMDCIVRRSDNSLWRASLNRVGMELTRITSDGEGEKIFGIPSDASDWYYKEKSKPLSPPPTSAEPDQRGFWDRVFGRPAK